MSQEKTYPELRVLAKWIPKIIVYIVKRFARGIVNIARIIVAVDERVKSKK